MSDLCLIRSAVGQGYLVKMPPWLALCFSTFPCRSPQTLTSDRHTTTALGCRALQSLVVKKRTSVLLRGPSLIPHRSMLRTCKRKHADRKRLCQERTKALTRMYGRCTLTRIYACGGGASRKNQAHRKFFRLRALAAGVSVNPSIWQQGWHGASGPVPSEEPMFPLDEVASSGRIHVGKAMLYVFPPSEGRFAAWRSWYWVWGRPWLKRRAIAGAGWAMLGSPSTWASPFPLRAAQCRAVDRAEKDRSTSAVRSTPLHPNADVSGPAPVFGQIWRQLKQRRPWEANWPCRGVRSAVGN